MRVEHGDGPITGFIDAVCLCRWLGILSGAASTVADVMRRGRYARAATIGRSGGSVTLTACSPAARSPGWNSASQVVHPTQICTYPDGGVWLCCGSRFRDGDGCANRDSNVQLIDVLLGLDGKECDAKYSEAVRQEEINRLAALELPM